MQHFSFKIYNLQASICYAVHQIRFPLGLCLDAALGELTALLQTRSCI